jgi:hypothetical protein
MDVLKSMFTPANIKTVGQLSAIGALFGFGNAILPNFMENPTRQHELSVLKTHEIYFLTTNNPDVLEKLTELENLLKVQTQKSNSIIRALVTCFDLLSGFEVEIGAGGGISTNYKAYPVVCMIKQITAKIAQMRILIPGLEADIQTLCKDLDQLADDSMYNIRQALAGLLMTSSFLK